jgi:peptidoglycan L-alanyl-D-glutamate endopeptidase CwlK
MAVDIALIIDGKQASWDTLKDFDGDRVADWMECVNVFKKHGWEWGGDWKKFPDMPHFQKTFGYTVDQLLSLKNGQYPNI